MVMMARYRSMALRPIHRIKHVVDSSATLAKATVLPTSLITAVDAPVLANTNEVETGAKVNGIYLKVEVASNDPIDVGAIPNVYMAVVKSPGDNLATIDPTTVGSNDNKRFVIHQEMIMIENKGQGSNARVLFNGVIAIPKGYRRFGPNDRLYVNIRSNALDIALCFQCHYKEFR